MTAIQVTGVSMLVAAMVACDGADDGRYAEEPGESDAAPPAAESALKAIDCSPPDIELGIEVFEDLGDHTFHARLSDKYGSLCVSGNLKEVVWRAKSALGPDREVVLSDVAWEAGACALGARENRRQTLDVRADPEDPLVWRGTRSGSASPNSGDCWRYGAQVTVTDASGTHSVTVDPEIIWRR